MSATQTTANGIAKEVLKLGPSIVVAHSQGNLLANLAYAKLVSDGVDTSKLIRIVNVANTSEFSVNNLNLTHSDDNALKALTVLPSLGFNWTRTTPNCSNDGACDFELAAPTLGSPTESIPGDNLKKHSMVMTYLSTVPLPVLDDQGVQYTPGADRFVDRFEDIVYAAAESFSSEDVDIPTGTYRLPDTGQTQSYTNTYGEDHDYIGNQPSYTDNHNGTVTDNNTGLMWQQAGLGQSYNWYRAAGVYDASYNPTTQNVCREQGTGGYSDWRLPTKKELVSIVDYGRYYPSINPVFTSIASNYWSSTTCASYSNYAWGVSFGYGYVGSPSKLYYNYVRCVRGG
ncbi:MAG: DUF1566 domain-containing protein, partial [Rectinemataceae bacterium]|nr:DUF1566 domain-containing protein [Rectinemataceae bacterium]